MKATYALFAAVLLVFALPAGYAQGGSIAGKWTGELPAAQGRGASQPITVELKLEGQTLTGSVIEGALDSRPITNAAIEGNTFSFRTTQNFGGQDIVVNWFGEVKGDDLALTRGVGPTVEAPGGAGGGGRGGAGAAGGGAAGRGAAAGGAAAPAAGGARGGAAPAAAGQDDAAQAGAAPQAGAARGGGAQGGGAARGAGAGGGARGGGGGGRGAAAAPAGVVRVNGGITLALRRAA